MKTFINKLLLIDHLNDQQIALISRKIKKVHLNKGEYYTEPGQIQSRLALIDKGILRYNYYNNKAENITSSLIGEGDFIAPASHLLLPIVPSDYLQAVEKCALLVIGEIDLEELSATILKWDNIVSKVSQIAFAGMRSRLVQRKNNMILEEMENEYLEKFPNLNKHLKVNQILNYLQNEQSK